MAILGVIGCVLWVGSQKLGASEKNDEGMEIIIKVNNKADEKICFYMEGDPSVSGKWVDVAKYEKGCTVYDKIMSVDATSKLNLIINTKDSKGDSINLKLKPWLKDKASVNRGLGMEGPYYNLYTSKSAMTVYTVHLKFYHRD
jgi:hypothetical protein